MFLADFLKLLSNQYLGISKELSNIHKSETLNVQHLREKVFEFRA